MDGLEKPNILIFMTDQQQNEVTYQHHPCQTKNINRLAEQGIRFNHVFTTMAHCCPSRASFMTGLYPSQHGIYNNVSNEPAINRSLKVGVRTFSETLNEKGYDLFYSGKWHVSGTENPEDRGWEELFVTATRDAYMGEKINDWKNRKKEDGRVQRKSGQIIRPGWGHYELYGVSEEENTIDRKIVNEGIRCIEDRQGKDDPWCLYIGVNGPHDPFVIPEKYAEMYDPDEISLPQNYYDTLQNKPNVYKRMRKIWDQLSEKEVKESIAHYWGYCTMVDDMFGEVLHALERTNQVDNTLVVFLSDHGESAGSHGLFLKGISPYDETYRIPCVLRWPKGIKDPGREINELISIMDFAPTFTDLVNGETLHASKGISLLSWFENIHPKEWRDAVFTQCNGVEVYYTQRIVRTDRYKFVYNPVDFDELYDLQSDPYELNNLADDPDKVDVKEELYKKMWKEAAEVNDIIFNPYPTVATADIGPACALGKI